MGRLRLILVSCILTFLSQDVHSITDHATMSFNFFNGLILTTLRAGLALKIVSSPVKGLIPFRALVAGFRLTSIFMSPGRMNWPAARFLI